MNRTVRTGLLVAGCVVFTNPFASASLPDTASPSQPIVLKVSDLRSAYLLRAGVVRYDESAMSPDGVRQQIQRHFDVVLGLLLVATPRSIETAIDRLETAAGTTWSTLERREWRRQLLTSRHRQMLRLSAYRDRGLFPQNEGQAIRPAPIFVDRHDTACAVGHLMRCSGWNSAVQSIRATSNLIHVPDASRTSVASWILRSGLTLEEAALIQPGYPVPVDDLIADYGPGELDFIQDGLRYKNFSVASQYFTLAPTYAFHQSAANCEASPATCSTYFIPNVSSQPNLANAGFLAGKGNFQGPLIGDGLTPVGTNWIVLGGYEYISMVPQIDRTLKGFAQANIVQRIDVQFDVSVVEAQKALDQISQHSYPLYGGFQSFFPSPGSEFRLTTRVSADGSQLGILHMDNLNYTMTDDPEINTVGLAPQNDLNLHTTIWLYNGIAFESYMLDFRLIPEPATFVLIAFGGIALFIVRDKRCRKSRAT